VTDPAALDLLLSGVKLLDNDSLARLLEKSPQLMPLVGRLERILGQCIAAGLRGIDLPPDAGPREIRRGWLQTLLHLDRLARLDHATVAALARGDSWQSTASCPCGCGECLKPVFLIDSRPSEN
jgi:hypothetical protein